MSSPFDPRQVKWIHVDGPQEPGYPVDHDYAVLGGNPATGVLDMLVRFAPGGHCPRHRHVAPTSTLVLEGEQHLYDTLPSGEPRHRVRRAGDYALSDGNDLHVEGGGPEGGLIYLSMHSRDGHLFDVVDQDLNVLDRITIERLLESR
jgi:quercetin dioxygenase-like cupin family protein